MREEMASSSSLCVHVCVFVCAQARAFVDHSLDHDGPRSLQQEQIVPLFLSDGRPVIFHHYLGTLKETSHPK